jgi:phage FluMu protein Com
MMERQNNRCAMCGDLFNKESSIYVDHDHKTGKVRGFIHAKCNALLAMAEDNTERLKLAIVYLDNSV